MGGHGHLRLGKLFGIPIGIHYSWFIIFVLIAVSLAQGFFPSCVPEQSTLLYWVLGLVTAVLFFASVLAHELAHSLVGRAAGMEIEGIDLFVFGGVSKLEDEPQSPGVEAKMTIVGPLTSFVLAAGFYGVAALTGFRQTYVGCAAIHLWWINMAVGVFNLVPAFPLDGGRVLRSILWHFMGNLRRATRIAAAVGRFFGYALIAYGIISLFHGPALGGVWLAFIGWFLLQAAESSYTQLVIRESIAGVHIRDIMRSDLVAVPAGLTVREAVDEFLLQHDATIFPVVRDGEFVGLLTIDAVRGLSREQWPSTPVASGAEAPDPDLGLSPDDDAEEAIKKLSTEAEALLVVVEDGRLVGVVSHRDLYRHIRLRMGLRGGPEGSDNL
jgi:Zn-dependent protease/CBS domain-containing protein